LTRYHDGVNKTFEYHAQAIASLQQQVFHLGGGLPEMLQETLRTARMATQEQQAPYAQLFRGLSPVLDLGCGRGEFLELLKQEGVSAYGVDSDHLACEEARRSLLNVQEGDLFEHLAHLPERSLGGIFCSRVIEYLPAHRQGELLSLCAGKLKPGGLLVIETINPDSDRPFGRTSHIDPSHSRALYPELLKSMIESNAFEDCRICVLAPQVCLVAAGDGSNLPQQSTDGGPLVPADLSRAPAYAAIARRG
jgi:2-polyprenyl-3-methyl-5-hydroxy-6-metoxy-1,4-benzoquinol methylase